MKMVAGSLFLAFALLAAQPSAHASVWTFVDTYFYGSDPICVEIVEPGAVRPTIKCESVPNGEITAGITGSIQWDRSEPSIILHEFRTDLVQYIGTLVVPGSPQALTPYSFVGASFLDTTTYPPYPPAGTAFAIDRGLEFFFTLGDELSDDVAEIAIIGGLERGLVGTSDGLGMVSNLQVFERENLRGRLVRVQSVPEPGTYALFGIALGMLAWVGRRRRISR